MSEGYIQVPVDGAGKQIDAGAIIIPAGTTITASDGTTSQLAADTIFYRQVVAIGDPGAAGAIASVEGESGRAALRTTGPHLELLASIDRRLETINLLLSLALKA